jgi:hypothetical protein
MGRLSQILNAHQGQDTKFLAGFNFSIFCLIIWNAGFFSGEYLVNFGSINIFLFTEFNCAMASWSFHNTITFLNFLFEHLEIFDFFTVCFRINGHIPLIDLSSVFTFTINKKILIKTYNNMENYGRFPTLHPTIYHDVLHVPLIDFLFIGVQIQSTQ